MPRFDYFLTSPTHAQVTGDGGTFEGNPAITQELQKKLLAALDPDEYGKLLFRALFPLESNLYSAYLVASLIAERERKPLQFRLQFGLNPENKGAHTLDWEKLYDPHKGKPLAHSPDTPFSRYFSGGAHNQLPTLDLRRERVKILVVVSNPTDLKEQKLHEIERSEIESNLQKTFGPVEDNFEIEFLKGPASLSNICARLVEKKFQILHLVAHGFLHPGQSGNSVLFEKEADGKSDYVDSQPFKEIMQGNPELRLVTLLCCHSGFQPGLDPLDGIGSSLITLGFPAVVAMRRAISFDAADHFCHHFYKNLANTGIVDVAMNEARRQLRILYPREASTPVLYLQLGEGKLWDLSSSKPGQSRISEDSNKKIIKLIAKKILEKERHLVPVIGPGITQGVLSSPSEIARRWAREFNYSKCNYPVNDRNDLPWVARFVAIEEEDKYAPHSELLKLLKNDLIEMDLLNDRQRLKRLSYLSEVIHQVANSYFNRDFNENREPHRILAGFNLPLYLTTNPDSFLFEALKFEDKDRGVIREVCRWHENDERDKNYDNLEPMISKPIIFHINGFDIKTESLVLTEDDYLDFLRNISDASTEGERWRIPELIRQHMAESILVFLGFNPRNLDFRVFIKGIIPQINKYHQPTFVLQVPQDSNPTEQVHNLNDLRLFLEKDVNDLQVKVYVGTVQDFLIELREYLKKEGSL